MRAWAAWRQRLATQWAQRSARERRVLTRAGAAVLLLCVHLIWVQDAWRTRARLLRELPLTQSARAEFKGLLSQSQARTIGGMRPERSLQPAVRDSLRALALDATWLPGATDTELSLRLDGVPLEKALIWFDPRAMAAVAYRTAGSAAQP